VRAGLFVVFGLLALSLAACSGGATATPGEGAHKSEFDLPLPDLHAVTFLGGISGWYLLLIGMLICVAGFVFGILSYLKLKNLPVHQSMRDVSELIYETCKAYLVQQGKLLHHGRVGTRSDRPAVLDHRYGRLLRHRLVRHPAEHLRQLPHLLRGPRGQALQGL
jgi:hypothetical protein